MGELNRLKGKIREKGSSYRSISAKIGMSLTTFNSRMNGNSVFDIVEASKVAAILDIPPEEIRYYFVQ